MSIHPDSLRYTKFNHQQVYYQLLWRCAIVPLRENEYPTL